MKTKAGVEKYVRAAYATRNQAVAAGKVVRQRMTVPGAWRLETRRACGMQDDWLWTLVCGGLRFNVSGSRWCCSDYGRGYWDGAPRTANPNQVVLKAMLGCRRRLAAEVREFHALAEKLGCRLPGMEPLAMAGALQPEVFVRLADKAGDA
jgi:hypothetical protein